MDIYDKVGGFANFIFVGRSGFLDHQEAEKGIRLMAKEVIPRLPAATATPEPSPPSRGVNIGRLVMGRRGRARGQRISAAGTAGQRTQ